MCRLEAATSRLEDIAVVQSGGAISFPAPGPTRPTSTTIPAPPPKSQPVNPVYSSPAAPDAVPPSVSAFDDRIIGGSLKSFIDATKALGNDKLVAQVRPFTFRSTWC